MNVQENSSERNTFKEYEESFHGKQIGCPVYLKKKKVGRGKRKKEKNYFKGYLHMP